MFKIIEHNVETNEVTEREMTELELQQKQNDEIASKVQSELKLELASQKKSLLEKLGISEEEAKLLLS